MLFIHITCQCPYIISQHSGQFLLKKKKNISKSENQLYPIIFRHISVLTEIYSEQYPPPPGMT